METGITCCSGSQSLIAAGEVSGGKVKTELANHVAQSQKHAKTKKSCDQTSDLDVDGFENSMFLPVCCLHLTFEVARVYDFQYDQRLRGRDTVF